MIALGTLLLAIAFSVLIVRVASQALVLTGLSEEVAKFQARSALTGTGFTSEEAEYVVNHPVRRRIITTLMILQNAGLITIISTSILSFVDTGGPDETARRFGILAVGLLLLWLLTKSRWLELWMNRMIQIALERWTDLNVVDYYSLLNIEEDYEVMRMRVESGSWLEDQQLRELNLPEEGVSILGIIRPDGSYLGVPRAETTLHAEDVLVAYGLKESLDELRGRIAGTAGDVAHEKAVADQAERQKEQEKEEEEYEAEVQGRS